jgi:hypothetical protein
MNKTRKSRDTVHLKREKSRDTFWNLGGSKLFVIIMGEIRNCLEYVAYIDHLFQVDGGESGGGQVEPR